MIVFLKYLFELADFLPLLRRLVERRVLSLILVSCINRRRRKGVVFASATRILRGSDCYRLIFGQWAFSPEITNVY